MPDYPLSVILEDGTAFQCEPQTSANR